MKKFSKAIPVLAVTLAITFSNCGSDTSNEARGEDETAGDSAVLQNFNNDYPNNRIHMNDSNKATDSVMQNDTVPMKPAH
ncbi:MAG: hypothetical protein EOO04_08555 [Chitinophagaceae bacterium]|nr:MAG: hypothetical protein EOO04_08555 [Chitinophagaceae bacterium]